MRREELLHHTEAHVASHRDTEADGSVPRGACAGRLPGAGQECGGRHPAQLRDGNMPASIIVARQYPTGHRIRRATPKALFARIEVAVVFVERAAQAECDGALDGVLAEDVGETLAVSGHSLFPLFRLVFPLIDP